MRVDGKKQVCEKGQRLEGAQADGRAMQRRSIVPADIAETFHGFSRGDATRNQQWREKSEAKAVFHGRSSLKCE